tara:strand:+ start:3901 stop:4734 length:834 start_codon:yes stop_codon:yes gene_type:complete
MANQQYYVVGGEYADTNFTVPAPGAELEKHGPFSEREAKICWRELTGKTVDNAMVRYFLKASEQTNSKIYWVVGGEYADSSFTNLASGKELEVFGPFEKWEALGFWRGMTSKSVDDALVRYDIRENYDQEKGSGASRKIAPSASADLPTTVKSIAIKCKSADAFAFLVDAQNWPRWAVHGVKSVRPGAGGFWDMETSNGPGQLKVDGNAASGIVDTTFVDGQSNRWTVPGRVVDAGGGAVVVMVFTKPASMTDDQFKQDMKLIEEELAVLKKILEQA